MTDTTDIKALLEKLNAQTNSYDTVIIRDFEAKQLVAAFEAERQSTAEINRQYLRVVSERDDSADELEELREEIAALKGEQVPVVITDDMAIAFHAATTDSAIGRDDMEEIKAGLRAVQGLFTTPQKPVVLPAEFYSAVQNNDGMFELSENCMCAISSAIEAAGGIVKDGE